MDSCVLPCLSYGSQTWIFNKFTEDKIQKSQRAMERSILNIKLKDKQRNKDIRKKTDVLDALHHTKTLKWKWAGHTARMTDGRWTQKVTSWSGPSGRRVRGRPRERWIDDIKRIAGQNWVEKAKERDVWKELEEAYTQKKGP